MKNKKEDIIRMVEEGDVEFIRLQFTDLYGRLKNMAVTSSQLEKAINNGCMFDAAAIEDYGSESESDMYLYPDLSTFEIFPWRPQQGKVARMFCDVYNIERNPYDGDPRGILKNVIKKAQSMGYEFNVGSECEFFLFNTDENGMPTTDTREQAGYFDCGPVDFGENARRDIVLTLEQMGLFVESSHHEMAPAQHEVDFKYSDALNTADNIQTFRLAVKTIAKRHGLHATFMPKPKTDCNGSGMHLNMSLTKKGKNVFYDSKDKYGLSKEAYYFLGGLSKHIKAITAITNPTVNSYKRLAGSERTLFRIPVSDENKARIELRSPDPSANPYLAIAVCLAAGLNGIEEKITPAASVLTGWRADNALPHSLIDAVGELKKDKLIKQTLGDTLYKRYMDIKLREWQDYQSQVTQWEKDEYLDRY